MYFEGVLFLAFTYVMEQLQGIGFLLGEEAFLRLYLNEKNK
ncbi:MAG TPA: hypothetical protein VGC75_05070 [Candidatus Nitrosocosmicus sp.]